MMPDDHRMQSCLDALYGTLTNPTMWPEAISSIKKLAGAASATFALVYNDKKNSIVGDVLEDALATEWENYYCHLDPRRSIARSSAVGAWITDDRLLDTKHSSSLEYVNDFARRAGLRWSRGGKVYAGGEGFATLALHRPVDASPFDDHKVLAILDYLLPHVQRVVRMHFDAEKQLFDKGAGTAIADLLELPICVVSRERKLLYMNGAAEKLFIAQQWISPNSKFLQIASSSVGHAALHQGVIKACAEYGRVASIVRVQSRAFAHFFLLKIIPLGISMFQKLGGDPSALIVIEGAPRKASAADLQCIFGLTAAEAELLSLLSLGYSVEQCAQHRGVRISTARTQVRAIFSKTGVSRQSELMRLLADIGLTHAR